MGLATATMTALTDVRALRALNMVRGGLRLATIGKELGVCKERARQLAQLGLQVELRMDIKPTPWSELRVRIRNALDRDGCQPTPDGVVEHFKTRDIKLVPAIGKLCIAELNSWLERHGKEPIIP
jgi:hypothetical protein